MRRGPAAAALLAAALLIASAAAASALGARSVPGVIREARGTSERTGQMLDEHRQGLIGQEQKYLNRCYTGVEPLKLRRDYLTEEAARLREALDDHADRLRRLPVQLNVTEELAAKLNATVSAVARKRARFEHVRELEVAEFKAEAKRARQLLQMVRTVIFRIDKAAGLQSRGQSVHSYSGSEYGGGVSNEKGGNFKPRSKNETEYGGSNIKVGEGKAEAGVTTGPQPAAPASTAGSTTSSAGSTTSSAGSTTTTTTTTAGAGANNGGGSSPTADAHSTVKSLVAEIHRLYDEQVRQARRLTADAAPPARVSAMMEVASRVSAEAGAGAAISEDQLFRLRWALGALEDEVEGYVSDLVRDEKDARKEHAKTMALVDEEEATPARRLAQETERMTDLRKALQTAEAAQERDGAAAANVTGELQTVERALAPMEKHCLRKKAHYTEQRQRLAETARTIKAIVRALDQHDDGTELTEPGNGTGNGTAGAPGGVPAAASPCEGHPCGPGTVCVPRPSRCGNETAGQEDGSDAPPCPQFRCDPTPEPGPNPCLARNPCPSNTICVARVRNGTCRTEPCEEEEYECEPRLGKHEVKGNETQPATCAAHRDRLKEMGILARSGVYILTDPSDGRSFPAYCDQATDGGGWMLAFKQTSFSSGSLQHSDDFRGAASLLSPDHDSFSTKSLSSYAEPEQMMFRAGSTASANNWFATPALNKYQYWGRGPATRYCLYRPLHRTTFFRSPTWNDAEVSLWDDVNVELMGEFVPSISAITVGRFHELQIGPECAAPHCSEYRNGRYNGACQDGASGEGNWLVFVR